MNLRILTSFDVKKYVYENIVISFTVDMIKGGGTSLIVRYNNKGQRDAEIIQRLICALGYESDETNSR